MTFLTEAEHQSWWDRVEAEARRMCTADGYRPDQFGRGHDDDPQWFRYSGEAIDIVQMQDALMFGEAA